MTILLAAGSLVAGLLFLVKGADLFVGAAEGLALRLGWSPAVIGAVVVGFGTSLPELVTSAVAALDGQPDLAIGNAAGSNVANLLLILGVAALVAPLRGTGPGPGRDIAIAAGSGLLLVALAASGELGLIDGLVLLAVLIAAVVWQVASARGGPLEVAVEVAGGPLVVRIIVGLGGVVVGARLLVWGATEIAFELGVPTIVIGSVLVAVGTSLPELATAIASARRGQTELLIGNLIGSNAFNALGVVAVAALVGVARDDILLVDGAAMSVVAAAGAVTAVLGAMLWRRPRLGRVGGAVLVALYVASVPLLLAVS
ncbi:MAG: calcium/sodium antiporter [Nitriliruptoraceae bacterium]